MSRMSTYVPDKGYSVGRSSYPDLKGVEQYVASAIVADQVATLCLEFDTTVAKNGDHLTVNEGIRSRPRQDYLYGLFRRGIGALAATPYNSTHDASRGSALDFGITMANGENRALTQAEFDWLHARGPLRGIQWTGRLFSRVEQWHHNGGYAYTLPPILDAPLPGTANVHDTEEDDMTPDERKMLKEVHDYVKGLHNTITDKERGVSSRVARVLDDTQFIRREFVVEGRGVRDRLASILTKVKGGN